MDQRNRAPFDTIVRLLTGVLLMTSAVCIALGQNPVPLINQPLVPEAAKPGGATFTLTVNGTGFVTGSVVHWNGAARTTTFVSQAQLNVSILATDIATARTASVTVVNPATGGGTSNVVLFPVTTPNSAFGLAESAFATSDRSYGVAVGDFNRDGNPDIAVTNYGTSTVSILLGNGNGTFQPKVDYATGGSPESVAVGDFNNDGKLDLVVANYQTVSVLLGNGDGTFQPQVEYATGVFPTVAVADFNRDGKLDLVVADYDNVKVLLGNGDGTLQPAVIYAAGTSPGPPAVGDFNRDGKLDLVVANNQTSTINVLLGNGNGTFQPAVTYSTAPSPTQIAVADFNADGKLDLAIGGGTGVSVLIGNGDGTFQAHVDYDTGSSNPCAVAVGDFNGDGKPDLVVADLFSTDVHLLPGNGNGTFAAASTYSAGSGPSSVAVADFNGDGGLDVAVADDNTAAVSVLLHATALVSSTSLAFGNQQVHSSSAPQSVTLTNVGPTAMTISSIAVTGANAGDFSQTHTCGSSVPALGGSCTISVAFTPTALGPRSAAITISDNAQGNPQVILLSGDGFVPGPVVALSATSLTFATQTVGTSSAAQSVTLTNSGSVALAITNITLNGADPGDFSQTNTCGASVAPGANCAISVIFTPKLRGSRAATLTVADDAAGNPHLISLSGTGTVIQLSPANLNFSCVVSSHTCPPAAQSSTLKNTGTTPLTISSITIAGAFSQTNNCPSVLGASGSCAITIHFISKITGTFHGSVSISDDGGGSPQRLTLYGAEKSSPPKLAYSAMSTVSIATVPTPTGPNRVGTHLEQVVDRFRDDPFVSNGAKRQLMVRFWYPASMNDGCEPAFYTSPELWNYFSHLVGFPLPEVKTNSCLDAPVAQGSHPVVVFTHGYTGTFTDYTFLFEDLASRGYVVASIDHTYESTAVEFPDGRFAKSQFGSHFDGSWRIDEHTVSRALSARLDDLTLVMNEVERMNASGDNSFAGKLDLTRVALAGHSLGGMTAWLGLQREPRFKAAILLDPYLADVGSDTTEDPVLLLTMGRDKPSGDECLLWNNLRGPRLRVNFQGAEHITPSDAVWLAKGAVKTGPLGPDKTIDALRSYIAAFLETNLNWSMPHSLIMSLPLDFPKTAVTASEQALCEQP